MYMDPDQETTPRQKVESAGVAAVREGCRILATTFLSLLLPLSFLLLSRLSTARYFSSVSNQQPYHIMNAPSRAFRSFMPATTLTLTLLVSLITISSLITRGKYAETIISERRRMQCSWILIFLIQVLLCSGIQGLVDAEMINGYTVGSMVLPRRVLLVLGLHETMVFWWRSVVKPVADETVFGSPRGRGDGIDGYRWVEKVALAVAFGNLWWRKLREEAEALVLLPWIKMELGMGIGMADNAGWWLYYLTAVVGLVRVAKGLLVVVRWVLRFRRVSDAKIRKGITCHDLESLGDMIVPADDMSSPATCTRVEKMI